MDKKIYDLLRQQIDTELILDDIAEMFYSAITAEKHLYPALLDKLMKYRSFSHMIETFKNENIDEEAVVMSEVLNLIEQELDQVFDAGEDHVKELLTEGPLAQAIIDDFHKRNIFMVQKKLHPDQIEQMYVDAFRKYDRLKAELQKRILELSPTKAYYRGEQVWMETRLRENILMDDAEMVDAFKQDIDFELISNVLALNYYRAIQFGRHYTAESAEDDIYDDEDEMEEEVDDMNELAFLRSQREPEILVEDGDLRECSFEYVCELFDEYTGRRVYPAEEDSDMEAYWVIYEDQFYDLVVSMLEQAMEQTLERLALEVPDRLENFAFQYDISKEQMKDPLVYFKSTAEFGYYFNRLTSKIIEDFGNEKSAIVFEQGRKVQEELDSNDPVTEIPAENT